MISRHRNNNPEEITETVFVGSLEELNKVVLVTVGETRTGEIPEYPRGLVCFDSYNKGYFNQVSIEDETSQV